MNCETPDSWIERQDEGPPMTDQEMCESGRCDHVHCEECGDIVEPGRTDYGLCGICDLEWRAARQLTYTPPTPPSSRRYFYEKHGEVFAVVDRRKPCDVSLITLDEVRAKRRVDQLNWQEERDHLKANLGVLFHSPDCMCEYCWRVREWMSEGGAR